MSYGTILILSAFYIKRYLEQSVNSDSENDAQVKKQTKREI